MSAVYDCSHSRLLLESIVEQAVAIVLGSSQIDER